MHSNNGFKRWAVTVIVVLMLITLVGCSFTKPEQSREAPTQPQEGIEESPNAEEPEKTVEEPPKSLGKKKIRIAAVGDIMSHDNQIKGAYNAATGEYDFESVFEDIRPQLESADLAIGNLETTISGKEKKYTGYPMFNCPESILTALKGAGFDVLTTANNHTLDRKEYGVIKTIENLDKEGILHTGSYASPEEKEKILIVDVQGINVAILAYTYGTNGMEQYVPKEKLDYMVNYIDAGKIEKDIQKARQENADVVIVSLHWGVEYTRQPNEQQKKLAEKVWNAGADIILGSHPHMVQPMERKTLSPDGEKEREVFAVYSMGNFVSDQRARYKDTGIIVDVEIEKDFDTGEVRLGEISYIPTWVYRYTKGSQIKHRILPAGKFAEGKRTESLNASAKTRVQQAWKEATGLVGEEVGKSRRE